MAIVLYISMHACEFRLMLNFSDNGCPEVVASTPAIELKSGEYSSSVAPYIEDQRFDKLNSESRSSPTSSLPVGDLTGVEG